MFATHPPPKYDPEPLRIPRPDGVGAEEKPRGTSMGELATLLRLQRTAAKAKGRKT